MKLFLSFFVALLFITSIQAQVEGRVTNIFDEPLIGATVEWLGTDIGVTTDDDGTFRINKVPDSDTLVFSYIGFKEQKIYPGTTNYWDIQLIEGAVLESVKITSKGVATRNIDAVANIEVLGKREFERSACCSLAGCFSTNASVEAAVTDVVTNAKELRVLGLAGVYNQILFDGLPIFQGLGLAYGTSSIPGTMIGEIYVSKGANSVIQGAESISGQINIRPKNRDNGEKIYLNALINSFGQFQLNNGYMHRGKGWTNYTVFHVTTPAGIVDRDGDDFLDLPKVNRYSIFNKWTLEDPNNENLKIQLGLRYWYERRRGGHITYFLTNPVTPHYGTKAYISQFEGYAKVNYKIAKKSSIIFTGSAFSHDQKSSFEGVKKNLIGNQENLYANLVLDHNFGKAQHNWKTGISIKSNKLNQDITTAFALHPNVFNFDYGGKYVNDYTIPGIFTEALFYVGNFTLLGGVRADKYGKWGIKLAPRFLARYKGAKEWDLRLSVGKGIRMVHPFSENQQIFNTNRNIIVEEELAPEEAITLGVNIIKKLTISDARTTIILDGYFTQFQNQVFPDLDRDAGTIFFTNYREKSTAHSFQIENRWEVNQHFDFKWAYTYQVSLREREGVIEALPLKPKHKVLTQASYTFAGDLSQLDLTGKWTGRQRLPDSSGFPSEFALDDYAKDYFTFDIQFTRRQFLIEGFEVYLGVENITDFRQEKPILGYENRKGRYFDPSFVWGPTLGREFYLGLRYKIK